MAYSKNYKLQYEYKYLEVISAMHITEYNKNLIKWKYFIQFDYQPTQGVRFNVNTICSICYITRVRYIRIYMYMYRMKGIYYYTYVKLNTPCAAMLLSWGCKERLIAVKETKYVLQSLVPSSELQLYECKVHRMFEWTWLDWT